MLLHTSTGPTPCVKSFKRFLPLALASIWGPIWYPWLSIMAVVLVPIPLLESPILRLTPGCPYQPVCEACTTSLFFLCPEKQPPLPHVTGEHAPSWPSTIGEEFPKAHISSFSHFAPWETWPGPLGRAVGRLTSALPLSWRDPMFSWVALHLKFFSVYESAIPKSAQPCAF